MPDWRRLARERVFTLGLEAGREADLIEELAGEMEEIYAAALEDGASAAEAERRALAALPEAGTFGSSAWWGAGLWRDLGHAWRIYARQPGFLLAAVVAIGVGIGASTTVFSLLDAIVLRPLDYRAPQELVLVWERFRGGTDNVVAPANFLEWRRRTGVLADASPVISLTRHLVGVGEPVELGIEAVGWNYLRLLGVEPALGRDFVEEDDQPETPAAVLLSHRLWQSRFAGDAGVLGKKLRLDGLEAMVVGVLPAGFTSLSEDPDLLTTARLDPAVDYRPRGRFVRVLARLAPGVSPAAAERELAGVARAMEAEHPAFNRGWGVRVAPLAEHFAGRVRTGLWALMAAVGFALLVVCGNVANLLLARVSQRERELAVRWALGAGPRRLFAQLMAESFLLALLGGVVGCGLAWWGVAMVRSLAGVDVPRLANAALDWRVLGFALVTTAVAAVVFGLAPAMAAWRVNAVEGLKEGARTLAGRPGGRGWRAVFVLVQTALALALVLGAGTLVERFRAMVRAELGFDARGLLTMSLILPDTKYAEPGQVAGFYAELERRLRRLPEMESVGAVAWLPLAGPGASTGVWAAGEAVPAPGEAVVAEVRMATPGYFDTMRMRREAGRIFRAGEQGRLVVSASLARALFPEGGALGRRMVVNMRQHDAPAEIVGVVADVRHAGLDAAPRPTVYYAHADFAMPSMTVVMRTRSDVRRAAVATVREMDAEQPVRTVRTMEEWIGRSVAERRWLALGCGGFAALAVMVACLGIYGAFAQMVAERRHELGVRLALGAERSVVVWQVVKDAGQMVAIGMAGGLLLYSLAARNWGLWPSASVAAGLCFAFISLSMAAVVSSARRVTELDPLVVLRQE